MFFYKAREHFQALQTKNKRKKLTQIGVGYNLQKNMVYVYSMGKKAHYTNNMWIERIPLRKMCYVTTLSYSSHGNTLYHQEEIHVSGLPGVR